MRLSILFAAIALFGQIGGIEAQEECQMNTPSRLEISSNNTFEVTMTYPYDFSCNITVEDANANDGLVYGSTNCANCRCTKFEMKSPLCIADYVVKPQCDGCTEKCIQHPTKSQLFSLEDANANDGIVYGSTNCVNYRCTKFEMKSPLCTVDYVVKPQCVGYSDKCSKHPTRSLPFSLSNIPIKGCPPGLIYACSGNVCENDQISDGTGPGCYCTNNAYLYQKNGTCLDPTDSQCLPTPGPRQSVNLFVQPCVEANTITVIYWNPQSYRIVRLEVRDSTGDLVVTRSDIAFPSVFIIAPPVGIYAVTVFWEDSSESEIKNFNESAMFITKQDNSPNLFRVTALPIDVGVSVCFSSAIKDVSYLCQHNNGPKMLCIDCVNYCRDNGTGTITIYTQDGVKVDSFQYRV